jgi:hypothetical protein
MMDEEDRGYAKEGDGDEGLLPVVEPRPLLVAKACARLRLLASSAAG